MRELAAVDIKSYFFSGGMGPAATKFQSLTGIGALATFVVQAGLVIAGVILLFYFILGGLGMVSGAGKNDPKQMEQAKATLTTGVIGFIVVLLAWWIVKFILQLLGLQNII